MYNFQMMTGGRVALRWHRPSRQSLRALSYFIRDKVIKRPASHRPESEGLLHLHNEKKNRASVVWNAAGPYHAVLDFSLFVFLFL